VLDVLLAHEGTRRVAALLIFALVGPKLPPESVS
jgi:hypothetical protein